ncbi:MAG TPA: hypothetical protein VG147_09855 [Solirubrobacteraceae bacterium]|jgi:hypothetical protein|nr:hypothetical protein [Solirubrobacteraceae bacterium]
MAAPEPDVFAEALEGFPERVADARPEKTTPLLTNTPPGYVSIPLPRAGKLWVFFSYVGEPAAEAWLWDQLKLFTPIKPNVPTVFEVRKGDWLVYRLGFPTQHVTLSWHYEE